MRSSLTILILLAASLASCAGPPSRVTDATDQALNAGITEMTPARARAGTEAAYSQFIDVRTPEEYAAGHAYRAVNIPLDTLQQNLVRIEKNEPVYLICATGRRSRQAAEALNAAGYPRVVSIAGGTAAWQEAGLPMVVPEK